MTEKIEWYREVLELEPNSKVFFPLARMLAENGDYDEAIRILQSGLDRHEEFLEARLFFIELLYKMGRQDACATQVEKLSAMFSSYAGFWQAWAACLSKINGEADTATVLNFLAAHFICGKLSLHEVIDQGLANILGKTAKDACTDKNASSAECRPDELSVGIAEQKDNDDQSCVDITEFATDDNTYDEKGNDTVDSSLYSEPSLLSGETNDVAADTLFSEQGADQGAFCHEKDKLNPSESQEGAEFDQDAIDLDNVDAAPQGIDDGLTDQVSHTDEGEEEHFSLRTRSMAEVLAEQGDYKGALDIYHELAAAAISITEKKELEERITILESSLLASQELELPESGHDSEEAGSGQDKLISMLEALAERVEARAQE